MPAAGTVLADRYRLLQRIGSGATGEVWRARDERLAREVAVKIVDLQAQQDAPGAVARFRREATASAAISSPHIVSVYDAGQDGSDAFLVMELLTGPSLKDLIETVGPLDLDRGLSVAAQTASGLADAHAAGFVHRDLKPGNVVMHNGVPKIVDFGIARLADPGDATQTSAATVAGTAAYMSPEQASGKQVSTPSDLYSFGCLLFAMFTGAAPFAGRGPIEQATAHVHEAAPALSERWPDAPPGLNALVGRLLSKDPAARPDARTVIGELERIAADHASPSALPDTAPLPAVEPAREHTAVMPAVEATPEPVGAALLTPVGSDDEERPPATRGRRGAGILPWLVTLLLAAAAAVVGWLVLSQTHPQPTPTASPTGAASTVSTPDSTPSLGLPSVKVSTTASSSPKASKTAASASGTPSAPSAPASSASSAPSPAPTSAHTAAPTAQASTTAATTATPVSAPLPRASASSSPTP